MTRRAGLTLIETLLAVGLICLLIAILIPAIQAVRNEPARVQSLNNLKNIILATHNFSSSNNNQLPFFDPGTSLSNGEPSVFDSISPYCEQNSSIFVSPADPTGARSAVPVDKLCSQRRCFRGPAKYFDDLSRRLFQHNSLRRALCFVR